MADTFNCPECGAVVQIGGLAPGRQVRCGFCRRLLEVPYLPRVVKTQWKRRRFQRPRWVVASWVGIGLAAAVVIAVAISQWISRQERARFERKVSDLVSASELAESEGELARALIDLDAAIRLRADAAEGEAQLSALRDRRQSLGRREAAAVLTRLKDHDDASLPVGEWLNLKARAEADRDLSSLRPEIQQAWESKLQRRIDGLLAQARADLVAAKPARAIETCDAAWTLRTHLAPDQQAALHDRIGKIVGDLARKHGIVIEVRHVHRPVPGTSPSGTPGPAIPNLDRSLLNKGFLPRSETSPWRDLWSSAPFRLLVDRDEQFEGTYMSSDNRLTRIFVRLALTRDGRTVWESTPATKTRVPLPGLSARVAGQIASTTKRSPEIEKLCRDDATNAINDRITSALGQMPTCEQASR